MPEFGIVERDHLAGSERPTLRRPHSQHAARSENQLLASMCGAPGALYVERHVQLVVREVLQHRHLYTGASGVEEQQPHRKLRARLSRELRLGTLQLVLFLLDLSLGGGQVLLRLGDVLLGGGQLLLICGPLRIDAIRKCWQSINI